jgi:predicted dehydrogenase
MAGSLRFPSGVLAQFDCALSIERREAVELVGTEGALHLADAFLPGTDEAVIEIRRGRAAAERVTVPGADEYRLMVEHFADCVLEQRPFRYDALEAGRNMRTIEALYRSARSGGVPVAVPPDGP